MPLAFGVAAHAPSKATTNALGAFARRLSDAADFEIALVYARSYEELTAKFVEGTITLAWLPPLPFLALERAKVAVPLVGHHRVGVARFESVLITRMDSKIRMLAGVRGKKIAWVDPLSTSGYVLPRIQLAALGVDPRGAFVERFYGSHDAAVRAVVGGAADLAATYAHVDADGRVVSGSWSTAAGAADAVRVLMSFGAVPADVTASRRALHKKARQELARAMVSIGKDAEGAAILRAAFNVDELRLWEEASYEPLRRAIAEAGASGLLGAIETLDFGML